MSQEQELIATINKIAFGVRSMDTAAEILEGLKGLGYRKQPALLTDEELKAAWDGAFDNPVTFTKKPTVEDLFNVRLRAIAKAQLKKAL